MLPSHKQCPICNLNLCVNAYVNEHCLQLDKKISYIKGTCNSLTHKEYSFSQVTSLYNELFYEQITVKNNDIIISNNYINRKTIISYSSKNSGALESLEYNQKMIEFDYPKMEKIIRKAKILALLL